MEDHVFNWLTGTLGINASREELEAYEPALSRCYYAMRGKKMTYAERSFIKKTKLCKLLPNKRWKLKNIESLFDNKSFWKNNDEIALKISQLVRKNYSRKQNVDK